MLEAGSAYTATDTPRNNKKVRLSGVRNPMLGSDSEGVAFRFGDFVCRVFKFRISCFFDNSWFAVIVWPCRRDLFLIYILQFFVEPCGRRSVRPAGVKNNLICTDLRSGVC